MAIKKSELYSSIWASCDELRGGMDASQYKDYVLFMLFIKYISDKYADSDVFKPPVIIPPGASFKDMVNLKGRSDIGDKINTQIIQPLVDNNEQLASSDFPDFNDPNKLGEGQAKVERLSNLIAIFEKKELDFSKNRAEHDDILGDAYEYLMRHFATESGKSKGQFYTPSEVSRVIAKVIGIMPDKAVAATTAYDPTCGSGSLLLKVAAESGKHITLEGQEKDVTTAGLARMNMILHDFPTAKIYAGNTLSSPRFLNGEQLRTYDFVVANPPFSDKTWSTGLTPSSDRFQRFGWGVPPAKQGDYAYLLHIIRSMKSNGKAACILPHGVLFRGNAEAVIRKELILSGYLKGIIGLPANLFYGTGIPACILVLDKENALARKGVFMIDASKGFIKDGNKNRLREQDIHKIVDTFLKQIETPRYARMVPVDEIADARNDYNLNLPRYIDSTEPEDVQDIDGHLRGGIPERDIDALDAFWQVIPSVRGVLFVSAGRPGYSKLRLPITEVKAAVLEHTEFAAFISSAIDVFTRWQSANIPHMKGFDRESQPKHLISIISESLLQAFRTVPLLDAYDIYQHIMDYWNETMQDDCYLIADEGWVAKTRRVLEVIKIGKRKGDVRDKGWTCDLVPKQYIVDRYFPEEQEALDRLRVELDTVDSNLSELLERYGGEEGVLQNVISKADALEAFNHALLTLWNEEDEASCRVYFDLTDQSERHAADLRSLTDHHYISALKDAKGRLMLKTVKDRLAAITNQQERITLTAYIEAEKQVKAKSKQTSDMLDEAQAHYLERLDSESLPEHFADFRAAARYLELLEEQDEIKREIRTAEITLDLLAYKKYPQLSEKEIKSLVVDDKWMVALTSAVNRELDRVSQTLAGRIRLLAERYAAPLPQLVDAVAELSARVDEHLKRMGAVWG